MIDFSPSAFFDLDGFPHVEDFRVVLQRRDTGKLTDSLAPGVLEFHAGNVALFAAQHVGPSEGNRLDLCD